MNILKFDNKYYKYESFWFRKNYRHDINGKQFPRPKKKENQWYNMSEFLEKLDYVEKYCRSKNNYSKFDKKEYTDCIICNEKNVGKGIFTLNRVRWEDALYHYVKEHHVEPSEEFINIIFNFKNFSLITKKIGSLKSRLITTKEKMMLKLTENQINIMDALMEHGGHTKKYYDMNKDSFKYSEHAGLLDFDLKGLNKIAIYGSTKNVSEADNEIYLPRTSLDAYEYEYIFHTHPPTPKPGGRTDMGIMYEFPSISDIFHFIEHYNNGKTQGSIVIAPEGMYNIRKQNFDRKKIVIKRDVFFNEIKTVFIEIQTDALNKYGEEFTEEFFYSKISQDREFIDRFNRSLNSFGINIDYYPRRKKHNRWMIETVYLPVYPSIIKREE